MKNILKIFIIFAFCAIFFAGCKKTKIEFSEVMHEDATIVNSSIRYDIGDIYCVVFECQHGGFIIEKKVDRLLYERFKGKNGLPVEVTYQSVYKVILVSAFFFFCLNYFQY